LQTLALPLGHGTERAPSYHISAGSFPRELFYPSTPAIEAYDPTLVDRVLTAALQPQ